MLDILRRTNVWLKLSIGTSCKTLAHNGAQVVEVLGAKEYEYAHIAGAINLRLAKLNRASASALIRDRMVVLYCYDYQ